MRSAEAFLTAAVRRLLGGGPPGAGFEPDPAPLDWDRVVRRAEAERLAPLLYRILPPRSVPPPILDRLRAHWVAGTRQHLLGVEQLCGILDAFARDGVPVIPLKGPAMAEALYPDPGLRPFTDLDLLVRSADLPGSLAILARLGYRHMDVGHSLPHELAWRHAATFVPAERPPAAFPVDLHWGPVDSPGLGVLAGVNLEELWERAAESDAWGRPVLALAAEDLLIYLALHLGVHHAFSGLFWQIDLALLLRRPDGALDWEAVVGRARRWRVARTVYFALRVAEERLGVGAPAAFLARLRRGGLRSAALGWVARRSGDRLERLDYVVPLLLADRGSDILRTLGAGLLPPGGWVRSRYGHASLLGGYLAHYGRIGKVCLRTLRAGLGR